MYYIVYSCNNNERCDRVLLVIIYARSKSAITRQTPSPHTLLSVLAPTETLVHWQTTSLLHFYTYASIS
jgi:hypothetical protein